MSENLSDLSGTEENTGTEVALTKSQDAAEINAAELKAAMARGSESLGGPKVTLVNGGEKNPTAPYKTDLTGIPFMVRMATYREGGYGEFLPGKQNNFLTLEAIVLDQAAIDESEAQRKSMRNAAGLDPDAPVRFAPFERIIVNDGSTGLYRAMTMALHAKKLIQVDYDLGADSERGAKGSSIYDEPMACWKKGEEQALKGIEVNFVAPAGLRPSLYNYGGKDAITFYFA